MAGIAASSFATSQAPGQPAHAAASAPVLEYLCLFTSDLKRKQKRWQDGRLKYHTFNRRVMVYDERGNFIGDSHWREDYDLEEGEEMRLERGAVIVQISDFVSRQEQDLTDLLDRKAREAAQRQARESLQSPSSASHAPQSRTIATSQPRRGPLSGSVMRPANRLPGGLPPGEGLPDQTEAPRPAKRQRREFSSPPSKSGYAQSLFGATLTLSAQPISTQRPRARPLSDITNSALPENLRVVDTIAQAHATSSSPYFSTPEHEKSPNHVAAKRRSELAPTSKPKPRTTSEAARLRDTGEKSGLASHPCPFPVEQHSSRVAESRQENSSSRAIPVVGPEEAEIEPIRAQRREPKRKDDNSVTTTKPVAKLRSESAYTSIRRDDAAPPDVQMKDSKVSKKYNDSVRETGRKRPLAATIGTERPGQSLDPPRRPEPVASKSGEPTVEEPRTELRIKTTRRRGLLSMSEKSAPHNGRAGAQPSVRSEEGVSAGDRHLRPTMSSRLLGEHLEGRRSGEDELQSVQPNGHRTSSSLNIEGPTPRTSLVERQAQTSLTTLEDPPNRDAEAKADGASPTYDLDMTEWILSGGQRPMRDPTSRQSDPRNASGTQSTIFAGPRLASLGKRGLRSKEIIGFIPRAQPAVPAQTVAPIADVALTKTDIAPAATRAKITNPATKGRKAAQKSDAAGQVPQNILPPTAMPVQPVTQRVEITSERKLLPGFSRAGGGPWSREAYELLGMERPR